VASITVSREDVFPNGTTVSAYATYPDVPLPAAGAPPGPVAASGVVSGGVLTLGGLVNGRTYILRAASPDRYMRVSIRSEADQSGPGSSGSVLFGQGDGSLTTSLPWRAPTRTSFSAAVVTVEDAVSGNVNLIRVAVNGSSVATLALATGQTTGTTGIDVDMEAGDLLTVERLAADGGACQVQIDR
jgi:hypothetical protein